MKKIEHKKITCGSYWETSICEQLVHLPTLIATHPPYANIISYTKSKKLSDDLSQLPFEEYLKEMRKVAEEAFKVLKPGKICAILIGDTRKHKHYVPIALRVMRWCA